MSSETLQWLTASDPDRVVTAFHKMFIELGYTALPRYVVPLAIIHWTAKLPAKGIIEAMVYRYLNEGID